ncbi:hypothetical protein ABID94_006105 [Streptomyces sp. PvR018]
MRGRRHPEGPGTWPGTPVTDERGGQTEVPQVVETYRTDP